MGRTFYAMIAAMALMSAARAETIKLVCEDRSVKTGLPIKNFVTIDTDAKDVMTQALGHTYEFRDGVFGPAYKSGPLLKLGPAPRVRQFVKITADSVIFGVVHGSPAEVETTTIDRRTLVLTANGEPHICTVLPSRLQI
jgi:hypothetical protein